VRIKICGITNAADSCLAARLGADAIGLNFYPQSPRYVDAETAEIVLRELPPFVEPVGVFVNEPLRNVFESLNQLGRVRMFQWHGENREVSDCYHFKMIMAFSVGDPRHVKVITHYLDICRTVSKLPAAVLIDALVPGQYGGTGKTVRWSLLADFQPGVPVILAGGLTPENVAEAIGIVRPYAVDVASGVEGNPGRKDPEKMRRFIANAREAAARFLAENQDQLTE
jgi:phosphoribosylanthranilate isomerase